MRYFKRKINEIKEGIKYLYTGITWKNSFWTVPVSLILTPLVIFVVLAQESDVIDGAEETIEYYITDVEYTRRKNNKK